MCSKFGSVWIKNMAVICDINLLRERSKVCYKNN